MSDHRAIDHATTQVPKAQYWRAIDIHSSSSYRGAITPRRSVPQEPFRNSGIFVRNRPLMDNIRTRKFCLLNYVDPRGFLVELRRIEASLSDTSMPERVRRLRNNDLKRDREMRDAALLCVGISERFKVQIWFAQSEEEDFDFVATWPAGDVRHFCPVQLKEVVPDDLNPYSSMADVWTSLAKYSDARELTVAVRLNRTTRFDPASLTLPSVLTRSNDSPVCANQSD